MPEANDLHHLSIETGFSQDFIGRQNFASVDKANAGVGHEHRHAGMFAEGNFEEGWIKLAAARVDQPIRYVTFAFAPSIGLQPNNSKESALIATIPSGNYTAIVQAAWGRGYRTGENLRSGRVSRNQN